MRTRGRKITAIALAALGLLLVSTACEPAPTPQKVSNTVAVRCAASTYNTPTDWFFPSGTPKGLVWLQHGFTETKADWDEFGRKLSAAGFAAMATTLPTADIFGCTVQNIGNNTSYLNNVASMLSGLGTPSSAISTSWADATKKAGRTGLAMPTKLTLVGHSAGGEAVLYVANRIRTASPTTFAKLKGLVLEDPVKSFIGDNTDASLNGLKPTSLPIYALASPPGSCNSDQSGTKSVSSILTNRSFHGAAVTTGTHGDIFGGSVPGTVTLACGTPKAANVAAVQSLSLAWLTDQTAGTTTATNYPGGASYQALVSAGTITTLP